MHEDEGRGAQSRQGMRNEQDRRLPDWSKLELGAVELEVAEVTGLFE